jgi:mRNA interferase RelE/StbE
MMEILISKKAQDFLEGLQIKDRLRLIDKINQYAENPESLSGSVKKLQGRDGFRLRVGDYRILFDKSGKILHITQIGLRGYIYG